MLLQPQIPDRLLVLTISTVALCSLLLLLPDLSAIPLFARGAVLLFGICNIVAILYRIAQTAREKSETFFARVIHSIGLLYIGVIIAAFVGSITFPGIEAVRILLGYVIQYQLTSLLVVAILIFRLYNKARVS